MAQKFTYFTVVLHALTGGRAFDGDATSPAGFLKLTATGRKSGQPRTVELIYLRDGDAYVLTVSNGGRPSNPGWFFNLQSNPEVAIEVHGVRRRATAEVASPEKRAELWPQLTQIAPMYAGYVRRTQRVIPMVIVRPTGEAGD